MNSAKIDKHLRYRARHHRSLNAFRIHMSLGATLKQLWTLAKENGFGPVNDSLDMRLRLKQNLIFPDLGPFFLVDGRMVKSRNREYRRYTPGYLYRRHFLPSGEQT